MGGKSRKSGGVSRTLIERLKAGTANTDTKKKKCGTAPKEPTKAGLLGDEPPKED